MYAIIFLTEWPLIGGNSCSFVLRCVSWCGYLVVGLFVFFGVGVFFLIAPFPDLCLLLPV